MAGVLALLAGLLAFPAPAQAATPPHLIGRIGTAVQHRDGSVTVRGWAYDTDRPAQSVSVCVAVSGRCLRTVRAARLSPNLDRARHVRGRHAFVAVVRVRARGLTVQVRTATPRHVLVDSQWVPSAGARIAAYAKTFVGRVPYREGGSSPSTGFDCSGYTAWVYGRMNVQQLPHNAQQQRFVPYMHRIARSAARPGDLVFYLSGSNAYHIAIYAGHGMQYAAATPQDGLRYQHIWSSDVEFRTDWH